MPVPHYMRVFLEIAALRIVNEPILVLQESWKRFWTWLFRLLLSLNTTIIIMNIVISESPCSLLTSCASIQAGYSLFWSHWLSWNNFYAIPFFSSFNYDELIVLKSGRISWIFHFRINGKVSPVFFVLNILQLIAESTRWSWENAALCM